MVELTHVTAREDAMTEVVLVAYPRSKPAYLDTTFAKASTKSPRPFLRLEDINTKLRILQIKARGRMVYIVR